jgi:hypothetical protein
MADDAPPRVIASSQGAFLNLIFNFGRVEKSENWPIFDS